MTKTYLIGYDLNKSGQDYSTSISIRDYLTNFIDVNDELLVIGLNGEAALHGFNSECSNWLKNNL